MYVDVFFQMLIMLPTTVQPKLCFASPLLNFQKYIFKNEGLKNFHSR